MKDHQLDESDVFYPSTSHLIVMELIPYSFFSSFCLSCPQSQLFSCQAYKNSLTVLMVLFLIVYCLLAAPLIFQPESYTTEVNFPYLKLPPKNQDP